MTDTAATISRPVLADRLVARSWATDVALVLGGVGFTAALAQVQVPMWPVPITGQTLAVMLVGATLGARVTVVCGVTIGRDAFVGAGAVVTADVPPNAFVVGSPGRQIGWACHCGQRLADDLRCSCGRRYALTGPSASRVLQELDR